MQPTPDQLARLPQWAQAHIRHQEMEIRQLTDDRKKVYDQATGVRESRVYVEGYGTYPRIYLPEERDVTFKLDDIHQIEIRFPYRSKAFDYSGIAVRSNFEQLSIKPECANVAEITVNRRG